MEYLRFHGEYDDMPLEEVIATYAKEYGKSSDSLTGDFDAEVEAETRDLAS